MTTYSRSQLAVIAASCAVTAVLVFLVAGPVAMLAFVLGLSLGAVYGLAR